MDFSGCKSNITACLTDLGLKICDTGKTTCSQHGVCITSIIPSPLSICVCDFCYYGTKCENEIFSNNLWAIGTTILQTSSTTFALKFLSVFFSCIQILNSLLCLQTYFSSTKVRITNIGVYLIFNSLIALLLGLLLLIQSSFLWIELELTNKYWEISCFIDRKFVYMSLTYIYGWSILLIAVERLLIECYHYGFYDSRKRSLIIITLVSIICLLTTIPGIFTRKDIPKEESLDEIFARLKSVTCVNYTKVGYIIDKIILSIHVYGTIVSYIILCLVVFGHMFRHRKRVAPNYTTSKNIHFILRNHRDFFIPLIATTILSTPTIVINEMMTCAKASQIKSLPYLIIVFGYVFTFISISISFFFYIYPANVYMIVFWRESPVGKLLEILKEKICTKVNNRKSSVQESTQIPQQFELQVVNLEPENHVINT